MQDLPSQRVWSAQLGSDSVKSGAPEMGRFSFCEPLAQGRRERFFDLLGNLHKKFSKTLCNLPIDIYPEIWYNKYVRNEREVLPMTHAAMNLVTAEVLTTNHANTLKRRVAENESWNGSHGYGKGIWVFAHGKDWKRILANKSIEYNANHPM